MVKELQNDTTQVSQSEVKIDSYDSYDDDSIINRPRPKKDKYSVINQTLRLPTPQRNGFRRQWVIDKERPIFISRDWKDVKGEDGQPMRKVMDSDTVKDPSYGTYMEIPEIYFQENISMDDELRKDVLERRIKNKDVIETAEGSQSGAGKVDSSKFYTPSAFENKIERNNNKK